jgi:hypothetical protein
LNTRWGGPSSPSAASVSIHLLSGFIFLFCLGQDFILGHLLSTNTGAGALVLVQALRVQERACPAAEVVHR